LSLGINGRESSFFLLLSGFAVLGLAGAQPLAAIIVHRLLGIFARRWKLKRMRKWVEALVLMTLGTGTQMAGFRKIFFIVFKRTFLLLWYRYEDFPVPRPLSSCLEIV